MYLPTHETIQKQVEKVRLIFYLIIETYVMKISGTNTNSWLINYYF